MTHILVESYDLTAGYLQAEMRKHLRSGMKVCVVAFSFRDSQIADAAQWDAAYARNGGRYFGSIVRPLLAYGIREEDVEFINCFADTPVSAAEKVKRADILYFPGGLMHRMVERIDEFELRKAILDHRGVIIGYSAGALIQLAEYHVSPDSDYPEFGYGQGLLLLKGLYLEAHYDGNPVQLACIARVLRERRRPVYAMANEKGAIVIDETGLKLLGDVHVFMPEEG